MLKSNLACPFNSQQCYREQVTATMAECKCPAKKEEIKMSKGMKIGDMLVGCFCQKWALNVAIQ
jgi:hypothetical protein